MFHVVFHHNYIILQWTRWYSIILNHHELVLYYILLKYVYYVITVYVYTIETDELMDNTLHLPS